MSARVDLVEGGRIALFSLRANRLRTVLTTVGIGIGVATLLAIVGIIQGLNTSFDAQLANIGANNLFVSKWPWVIKGDWWEFRNRKDFTLEDVELVRAQSTYATAVAPMSGRSSDVAHGPEQVSNVRINGTTREYLTIGGLDVVQGRFLTDADNETIAAVAVLGADVAGSLFPGIDPLGRSVRIDGRPFRVVGVLGREGKLLDNNLDLQVLVPFKTFRALFGKGRSLTIAVSITRLEDLALAEDQLVGILRRARGTPPDAPEDFSINKPDQLASTYEQLTGALYGVATGIGLITLLVGGIGIMNIMLVSVRERTREIGVRRALGARKRTIVLQFLMEASAVSAFGGALGTAVGLAGAKIVSEISPLAAAVQPLTVAGGVGFAGMVGLLFGIWPAARAANLDPVEALRYE
ncbi:MAG: ABC transporter permease [Myxococcaceae bacterium]|nr:ABC transporter permease [Myxococcaceae bacterium]MCI0671996.1 ABC transporter permease [Myxococcaceae bacterium]